MTRPYYTSRRPGYTHICYVNWRAIYISGTNIAVRLDVRLLVRKVKQHKEILIMIVLFVINTENSLMHIQYHANQLSHNPNIYTTNPHHILPSRSTGVIEAL